MAYADLKNEKAQKMPEDLKSRLRRSNIYGASDET